MAVTECNICFGEPRSEKRSDALCDQCGEYIDWWNSLTRDEQRAEHASVEEHCRIQHEMGYDKE
jgi:hypothetical protein